MAYRYIGHTADIIVEGDGRTLAEAIEETAAGIIERIGRADKEDESFEFEEHAESLDELIVYSLSYILTGCESRELQPHSFKVLELDAKGKEKKIKVRIGAGQGKVKDVVKAVTYHEVSVEQKKGKAVVRVLLDI
ncbi:MAG: archease [Candidatus Burarchaeum sp.]|nr:archease [Candidatus Burarchaeum sp.]MDO8339638.1 archease [Candidatus Burarchaeum sp.]